MDLTFLAAAQCAQLIVTLCVFSYRILQYIRVRHNIHILVLIVQSAAQKSM